MVAERREMKKSINQWAFPKTQVLEKSLEVAKDSGFSAIEVCFGEDEWITQDTKLSDVEILRKKIESHHLKISSLASGLFWKYALTSDSLKVSQKASDIIRSMLKAGSILGVDTILVIPGWVSVPWVPDAEIVDYKTAHKRALESLKVLSSDAEKEKVCIGIENVWNRMLLSPLEMAEFIDKIGSPYVGAYFDIGNVVYSGHPQHWIDILGHRIKKVHFKDYKNSIGTLDGFVPLLYGDVNWKEVMKALRGVGYNSYCVAEFFPKPEFAECLIKQVSMAMDKILEVEK